MIIGGLDVSGIPIAFGLHPRGAFAHRLTSGNGGCDPVGEEDDTYIGEEDGEETPVRRGIAMGNDVAVLVLNEVDGGGDVERRGDDRDGVEGDDDPSERERCDGEEGEDASDDDGGGEGGSETSLGGRFDKLVIIGGKLAALRGSHIPGEEGGDELESSVSGDAGRVKPVARRFRGLFSGLSLPDIDGDIGMTLGVGNCGTEERPNIDDAGVDETGVSADAVCELTTCVDVSQGGRSETNAKRIGFFKGLSGGDTGGSVYVPLDDVCGVCAAMGKTGRSGIDRPILEEFAVDVGEDEVLRGEE